MKSFLVPEKKYFSSNEFILSPKNDQKLKNQNFEMGLNLEILILKF